MESHGHPTIQSLACFIYVAEGSPEGRAARNWVEAEEQFVEMGTGNFSFLGNEFEMGEMSVKR